MNDSPGPRLQVTRRFEASPERVFDAFLDPATAGRFMFATPAGEMVRVEIDPRVGGQFLFVDRRNGEDFEHVGEYREIERPRRLAFTFFVRKCSEEPTRVAIEFAALDSGCEATLTHHFSPQWEHFRDRIAAGWSGMLDRAAAALQES